MILKQMLRAFADDVVCVTKTPDVLKRIIKSFEKLMDKYIWQSIRKRLSL